MQEPLAARYGQAKARPYWTPHQYTGPRTGIQKPIDLPHGRLKMNPQSTPRENASMRRLHWLTKVNALGAGALFLFCVAAGHGQGTLPADDVARLVAQEAKDINAELAKPNFLKKG